MESATARRLFFLASPAPRGQADLMSGESVTGPETIAEAGAGDAAAIAAIHTASWREVYRGILPDRFLDHDVAEERQAYWDAALASPRPGDFTLTALRGGTIRGFISVMRGGEPGYDAVIESLHVLPGERGGGLGRRLIGRAAARLIDEGASAVALRVYDANKAAIRFYERLGGQRDGTGIDPFAGADMPDIRYGWRDLPTLAHACAG
jgi:ribosomal protein S18 acetylase RimI-like enzyme